MDAATTIIESAFRLSILLAFAAVGEWVAERSGTLNISVEGMLLSGAFGGALGSSLWGSSVAGMAFGVAASLLVALVQANFSHRLTANQFVVGLTLNLLVVGLTAFLIASLDVSVTRAGIVEIPVLSSIPLVGTAFFGNRWPVYLIYPLVPLAWWLMFRTRWGLEVRAVGEDPQAADVTGIHVNKRRRQAIMFCGVSAGLGGAYLTVAQVGVFSANMTGGRGFLALAAVIFGGWTLRGTIAGCIMFGTADALRLALPTLGIDLNSQLLIAAPYVLALVTMLAFARRSRQPAALARPFVRGLV
ncbi:MAG: ABC transporter permease [Acidimicrobiales bacterium]